MSPLLGIFGTLGTSEMLLLLVLGVLLFGKRLPEVGRYLGKGIIEFKKGIKGLEDDMESPMALPRQDAPAPLEAPRPPQRIATTAPKFEDNPTNVQPPPAV
jgi:sec-independent protein translocase protein TatA